MVYKVRLTRKASKQLEKLGVQYRAKTVKALDELEHTPLLGIKLKGPLNGLYKVKIPPIRIIYQIDTKTKVIIVVAIGHRQGIYG